jgi:hypothetical protein
LLRDADGDGVAEMRTVFLQGLNSPFGMALVGHDLYSPTQMRSCASWMVGMIVSAGSGSVGFGPNAASGNLALSPQAARPSIPR